VTEWFLRSVTRSRQSGIRGRARISLTPPCLVTTTTGFYP
jgi:hypothetical protein